MARTYGDSFKQNVMFRFDDTLLLSEYRLYSLFRQFARFCFHLSRASESLFDEQLNRSSSKYDFLSYLPFDLFTVIYRTFYSQRFYHLKPAAAFFRNIATRFTIHTQARLRNDVTFPFDKHYSRVPGITYVINNVLL